MTIHFRYIAQQGGEGYAKFRILYFIILKEEFASTCLYTAVALEIFLSVSSTTMESIPLKELDFGF